MLDGCFFSRSFGMFSCGFSTFCCHIFIIAHFSEKHKGFKGRLRFLYCCGKMYED
jgi:hypothetical protein